MIWCGNQVLVETVDCFRAASEISQSLSELNPFISIHSVCHSTYISPISTFTWVTRLTLRCVLKTLKRHKWQSSVVEFEELLLCLRNTPCDLSSLQPPWEVISSYSYIHRYQTNHGFRLTMVSLWLGTPKLQILSSHWAPALPHWAHLTIFALPTRAPL